MGSRKALFAATLAVAFSIFGIAAIAQTIRGGVSIVMNTKGFPSVGKSAAPIEVVLIEDFQCKSCRTFSKNVLPKLQNQYVKQGKVRFTLVPVSFLAGSQSIANALMEVYIQNPRQFFSFLNDILNYDGEIKVSDLMRIARRVQGIDLQKLEKCIQNGCHNKELHKNLSWAQEIMGVRFRTPALYVNGAVGSTYSYEAIQYQIDQMLRKK